MNNRERLFAAFDNKPVDRVPVGFWFHFLAPGLVDDALERPELAKVSIDGHRAYIKGFRPDFVKIMSDGYAHYPIGRGEDYSSPQDLEKITVIDRGHPWITQQVGLVREVVAMQEDTSYFYNFFSPVGNLQWLIGEENFYELFTEAPERVAAALDTIAKAQVRLAEAIIKDGGADGIYLSVSNPDRSKISDKSYEKHIAPSEVYILEEVRKLSEYNILHICGFTGKQDLLLYSRYPAKAVSYAVNVEGLGLSKGKALFGGRTVIGGFPNTAGALLHAGTEEEIKSYALSIIEDAGTQGVIIGADCTLPGDIDLEHLKWARQAIL